MACPNINSPEWKALVGKIGVFEAMREFIKNGEEIPPAANYQNTFRGVNATLKVVAALQKTPRQKYPSNQIQGFYNDLVKYGAPKDQIELLKQHIAANNITEINTNDLIVSLLSELPYTVEIEVANNEIFGEASNGELLDGYGNPVQGEFSQEYPHLTVPGGTNYRENRIVTPDIIPSIPGHAAFAKPNDIGWFRSDDRRIGREVEKKPHTWFRGSRPDVIHNEGEDVKTRRILEVQSDLFQKIRKSFKTKEYKYEQYNDGSYHRLLIKGTGLDREVISKEMFESALNEARLTDINNSEGYLRKDQGFGSDNVFLQLLRKDNNWVTFFVKSIIQDSAKKGYEKVLFPAGDTANKVEGQQTLEDFIRQKEERIKKVQGNIRLSEQTISVWEREGNNEDSIRREKDSIKNLQGEIEQLEKEIKDAKEGRTKFAAINRFYETDIQNILKKRGYNPARITDEYGNDWFEVSLNTEITNDTILFQVSDTQGSKSSAETNKKTKEWLKKIGVDLTTKPYISIGGQKVDANGLSNLLESVIEIVEGKENVALIEEAMHFATYIIRETNPELYKKMLNRIDQYQIYNQTLQQYKNDPLYQKDGKPDIPKIKFEAIGKLLVEYYIQKEEGFTEKPELLEQQKSWIQSIIDWFKNLISKHGNPFLEGLKFVESASLPKTPIKKGVSELFQENAELATIGTPRQYSQYLDTIFPDSKVKDIVAHGTNADFEKFDKSFYSSGDPDHIYFGIKGKLGFKSFAKRTIYALVNIKNPNKFINNGSEKVKNSDGFIEDYTSDFFDNLTDDQEMGGEFLTQIGVKEPEQIHILGSKQDIEGFRKWVKNNPSEIYLQKDNNFIQKLDKTSSEVINKPIKDEKGEDSNAYFIGDKRVKTRATSVAKNKSPQFTDRKVTPRQKEFEDQRRDWGIRGHNDMQKLFKKYLTSAGTTVVANNQLVVQNNTPIQSEIDPYNKGLFPQMEKYVQELLLSYPEGTIFRPEQTIYSSNGGAVGERDIAGTMDFIAIMPDGKKDILDWKFLRVDKEYYNDIAWYKQNEWKYQMQEYKKILKKAYDIKDNEFRRTRMIPFVLEFEGRQLPDNKTFYFPTSLETAGVDLKIDDKTYLLPVATEDESTGDEKLDSLVRSLTNLYNTMKDVPASEHKKNLKAEQLNKLFEAIRHLQIAKNFRPLTEQINLLIKDTTRVLNSHNEKFKDVSGLTEEQISEEFNNLMVKANALHLYSNLDVLFGKVYGEKPSPEEMEILEELRDIVGEARFAFGEVKTAIQQFGNKYIAERRSVKGLLEKERTVSGLSRQFDTTSELPTAALQTLFKMEDAANNKAQFDLNEVKDELISIKKEIDDWGGIKKALKYLVREIKPKQPNESDNAYKDRVKKEGNKLIKEYDKEFYDKLKLAQEKNDLAWIKENIDNQAFEKYLKDRKEELEPIIKETVYHSDEEENTFKRQNELAKLAFFTDTKNKETYTDKSQYYHLRKFPAEKWKSEEYKNLSKIPSLFRFYNFIRKWNQLAREIGYISGPQTERNFLPYVYKSYAEKLNMGGDISIMDSILSGMIIDENIEGYGSYSSLEQGIENSLPRYFTLEIDEPSQISENLILNMGAYIRAVINYKYKQEIDGQVRALYFIEQNKESLKVQHGKLIRINGVPQPAPNDQNTELLLNHIRSIHFGQKYTSQDVLLGDWAGNFNKFSESLNKKIGFDVIPKFSENLEGKQISLTRLLDGINRFFTIKNMGLNVATSLSVYAGGNFQAIINSGKYYTNSDLLSAEFQFAGHKVLKSLPIHMELIKTFMPIDENLNRELAKLTANKFDSNKFSEFMMFMMRSADHIVQYANFLAFIRNTIVVDGKLYNAREYYRNSKEFQDRYTKSPTERQSIENQFDTKVEELISKHGILNNTSIEKGQLKIKGIENIKNENLFEYRTLISSVGRRATGNITPENEMLMRMNPFFRSMLVFKNWIPGLVKQRTGGLRFDSSTNSWEYGRLRMLMKHLGPLALLKIGTISDIIKGNEKGLQHLTKFYEKQKQSYKDKTNKELEMSPAEFYDMFRQGTKNELKELSILLSMIGIVTAILPLFKPTDDEERELQNRYKFVSRLLDKVKDEVWFYYNPIGLQQILNGSIFPALGTFTDVARVVTSLSKEVYGLAIGDEEIQEKAFPLKNIAQGLPITKELLYYLAMFDADLAKEFGIRISSQSRMK